MAELKSLTPPLLDAGAAEALASARHGDPFAILGPHVGAGGENFVRVFLPGARRVELIERGNGAAARDLDPADPPGLFHGIVHDARDYRLRIHWPRLVQETADPYAFGFLISDFDLHLFNEGRHFQLAECLGARCCSISGIEGVRFAVWAPNAARVAVVGEFNSWDNRRHPMRLRHNAGVWEIFVPGAAAGARYKFDILARDGTRLPWKADPLARASEAPPRTASIIAPLAPIEWHDESWMARRRRRQTPDAPISIYEVHLGSWFPPGALEGRSSLWEAAADRLVAYASEMGFTHVELLPIAEHPFGGSWGYQPLSLYAPTARYGAPQEFAAFVDRLHQADIGIILDWVPAHFPNDAHGLARFDGTALYEHEDPREGLHRDWNTLIYNFGRTEVQGFLIAAALYWLEHYHVDGLRVDAVASMLYRDYSRKAGEWVPNIHGGRENLEAIGFLRHLNVVIAERCPGTVTIAEESTAWPGVSAPVEQGGLGFSYKWNMGWMHDTLDYMSCDPLYRSHHHDRLTFGLIYAFSERFILPLSHDEVVYGKRSLIGKMPGDHWQRFANLRAYLGFMWGHPGKKLLFMGGEFAQETEWNHDSVLDWRALQDPFHGGVARLIRDLNRLYAAEPSLYERDAGADGFQWVIGDDRANSVIAFLRFSANSAPILVVCNFTPVPRDHYRIGVPFGGAWHEVLNTDAAIYQGSNVGNLGGTESRAAALHGMPHAVELVLPPLATLMLKPGDAAW